MKKLELKINEFKAIQWEETEDCFSEMKRFCGDMCIISYETCDGIGDFWLLQLKVGPNEQPVTVPVGDWVIKGFDGNFYILNNSDIKEYFNVLPC